MRIVPRVGLVLSLCGAAFGQQAQSEAPKAPVAKKIPKVDVLHGDSRTDYYFWLRDKENPEVVKYLEAENAYTAAMMRPTVAFQETLYKEMLGRIQETDLSVPYRDSGYFYYSRTEQGKQYPILCRKKGSLDAAEQITIDVNELAKGQPFMAVGAYEVSDDGRLLAYSTDATGFREYVLSVKNLATGQLGPERIEKVSSVVWAGDNRTLFYTIEDAAKRAYRVYRHELGRTSDDLVYEEKDEHFEVSLGKSRSKAYLFISSDSHTTSEVRYLPADRPGDAWKVVSERKPEHEYEVEHHGEQFFIRTNDAGRNFRLVSAPARDPRPEHWKEIVPHRSGVMLEGMDFFARHYVLWEREDGLPHARMTDFHTGRSHRIELPEPAYSLSPGTNAEFDSAALRYSYQSFVTPQSVYDYDMDRRESKLLKETPVLGGYDRTRYRSERLHATAGDGTRIPLSLVCRRDLPAGQPHPMLLTGYGSYGFPLPVSFSSARLSLLDRGLMLAIAHIRGGGEMGKAWHDSGRMLHKKNTFADFVTAAEHLIARRYTASDRLVIEGGSAGGLLMGAVTNMRPDLFRAVVSHVPFVDVINTMSDTSLPLTVGEFEEWGNPAVKAEYDYMKTYCPYSNLARRAYPAMLVKTSFHDSQVMYWEPAKYVAKLRSLKTDDHVLLLQVNMAGGHGGSSGRYDRLRELAFDYAFVLGQLDIKK
jgi:oligopeptidase B